MKRPHMVGTVAGWRTRRQLVPHPLARYVRRMDDEFRPVQKDELEEAVEQALWKARKLLPRKREPGVFDPYRAAAGVVVEHLKLCGITFWRKPPPPLPGSSCGLADEDANESETRG